MKFNRCIAIITAIFLIAISGLATADVLPGQVPENQIFSVGSSIDAVGVINEATSTVWQIGDKGLDALPNATGQPGNQTVRSGSIAIVTYSDFLMSNGGQIAEVKTFTMDTKAKTAGLYNIETQKVLTYTSQNGSHLMGAESFSLDVAGNWSTGLDDIVCVFSRANNSVTPAFCNKVTASSKLMSINTAQVQTIGGLTAVGQVSTVPAALNYQISVTPDVNSASGFADGIISTAFTVSVMEGRSDGRILNETAEPANGVYTNTKLFDLEFYDQLASTLTFVDTATVAGGISSFNKDFNYQSGIACCA
ncbi:MAG: hypothetical protein LBV40_01310 [Methanomicrobiales archaeon]|jgi:hypothetical protein|nr:hypothetical protein [Methanomicrobiales archaeon]